MQFWDNYMIVLLVVFLISAVLFLLLKLFHRSGKSAILIGLAFMFMIAGYLYEDQKLIGDFLIGFGIVLSIIDVFRNIVRSDS